MAATDIRVTPEQLQQVSAQLDAGASSIEGHPAASSPATSPRWGRTGPASPRPRFLELWAEWQRSGAALPSGADRLSPASPPAPAPATSRPRHGIAASFGSSTWTGATARLVTLSESRDLHRKLSNEHCGGIPRDRVLRDTREFSAELVIARTCVRSSGAWDGKILRSPGRNWNAGSPAGRLPPGGLPGRTGDAPAWSSRRQPYGRRRRAGRVSRGRLVVPYAELHCHSNASFLDGGSHPEELAEEAARLRLEALAITDHDGMYGIVRFAEAAGRWPPHHLRRRADPAPASGPGAAQDGDARPGGGAPGGAGAGGGGVRAVVPGDLGGAAGRGQGGAAGGARGGWPGCTAGTGWC